MYKYVSNDDTSSNHMTQNQATKNQLKKYKNKFNRLNFLVVN